MRNKKSQKTHAEWHKQQREVIHRQRRTALKVKRKRREEQKPRKIIKPAFDISHRTTAKWTTREEIFKRKKRSNPTNAINVQLFLDNPAHLASITRSNRVTMRIVVASIVICAIIMSISFIIIYKNW